MSKWSTFPQYTEDEKAALRAVDHRTDLDAEGKQDLANEIKFKSKWWRESPYRRDDFRNKQFSPRMVEVPRGDGKVRRHILYPMLTSRDIEECLAARAKRGPGARQDDITCTLSASELRDVVAYLRANNDFERELRPSDFDEEH